MKLMSPNMAQPFSTMSKSSANHVRSLATARTRAGFLFSLCLLLLASSISLAAQQSPAVVPATTAVPADSSNTHNPPLLQERNPRYILQPGDTFDVSFDLSPEFNQSLTIQPDGYVTLRGVGDVHVAGETVPQLNETIRTAYGKVLNDPIISILLKDFEKPYFTVDGQVGKPGKYDLRGGMTVTQALAVAGGTLPSAKHSQVLLFRRAGDGWVEARILNVKKMMKEDKLNEDMQIRPGDMVFVPKNVLSKIDRYMPSTNVGTYLRPY
jgi:polysaccharide biosynthesis/export protein